MEARVSVHGEVTVIHLSGRVDFDSQDQFRTACLSNLRNVKVVFDLSRLDFVGSNAITPFVRTLRDISQGVPGIRLYGVGPEFRKILNASSIRSLAIFENQQGAIGSYEAPRMDEPVAAYVQKVGT